MELIGHEADLVADLGLTQTVADQIMERLPAGASVWIAYPPRL